MGYFFILLIKFYQLVISPYLGSNCRYTPTCSQYAILCFKNHNVIVAVFLSVKRIIRCNPFGGYGYDPIPLNKNKGLKDGQRK